MNCTTVATLISANPQCRLRYATISHRDYPQGGEGVITLGGVEHCFVYAVHGDVVDTVIWSPDYIEQVINARRQNTHEDAPPALERNEREWLVMI